MAWIEVHDTLREHRKTYALASALRVSQPTAIGHLVSLWTWAINNAQDGDLSCFPADAIARACFWDKKPSLLIEALQECGFVTRDMTIHDWDNYAGKLLEQREIQREQSRVRQQKRRDKLSEQSRVSHAESNAEVTRDITQASRVNYEVTVPNLTVPISSLRSDIESDAPPPKKPVKHKHGQYQNVLLTDEELEKVKAEFPRDWAERVERLSEYIASKGAAYKNHLATIRAWAKKDKEAPKGKVVGFQNYDQGDTADFAGDDLLAEARELYDRAL